MDISGFRMIFPHIWRKVWIWRFPKIGVAPNHPFSWDFPFSIPPPALGVFPGKPRVLWSPGSPRSGRLHRKGSKVVDEEGLEILAASTGGLPKNLEWPLGAGS